MQSCRQLGLLIHGVHPLDRPQLPLVECTVPVSAPTLIAKRFREKKKRTLEKRKKKKKKKENRFLQEQPHEADSLDWTKVLLATSLAFPKLNISFLILPATYPTWTDLQATGAGLRPNNNKAQGKRCGYLGHNDELKPNQNVPERLWDTFPASPSRIHTVE